MGVQQNGMKFEFVCDEPRCGFSSTNWDTTEQAQERFDQHLQEHATGEPMIELADYQQSVGYVPTPVEAAAPTDGEAV